MRLVIILWFVVLGCSRSDRSDPAPQPPPPVAPAPAVAAPDAAAPPLDAKARRALGRDGRAAYDRKEWAKCAELLERAEAWYDAACCHALAGDKDKAFAMLERVGGRDVSLDHLQKDPDLAALRGDARWQKAVDHLAATIAKAREGQHAELAKLHDADQAARMTPNIDWKVVAKEDEARRKRVLAIVNAGGAKLADDWYHAAMVFQHGSTPADAQRAHDYAKRAVELDPDHGDAKWLMAASLDRKLMYEKKPQKYGTQYTKQDANGPWILWDVDPSTTDAEREALGVPSLAEAKARAAAMNARKP